MAQLPAPYYPGPDKVIRKYDSLLKRNMYWYWPMSSETGNYVTLDLANYLFDTVDGTENDLMTIDQLPEGVRDTADSYADDLQSMFDQNNRVKQSIVAEGGYTMDRFPASQKNRRRGLATVDITDIQDYGTLTDTRERVHVLDAVDLDQQIHSTVGLSVEAFMAVAQVQGLLVPFLTTFEGRPVEMAARVSLATFIGAIMPTILAQLPTQVSPTNPVNPTKVLSDFSRNGPDSIIEGIMDTQYRANVIYSDGTSGVVVTQGKDIDGFYWAIIGQGEQISVAGILPIYPNNVYGDGRSFVLELRHVSLPKVDRGTIQIIDGTAAPAPPATAEPFIELLIDVDARTIRVRYRLANATKAALAVFRDGAIIYSSDNLPAAFDTSLNQTVSPGVYYAVAYEPNVDKNRQQSAPQTIKGAVAGSSIITAIDYAHKAKGTDGYPELDLWFNASVNEDIAYTLKTEDLPETSALPTKAYSGSDGYIRQQQQTNVRGGQLVTIKAWTLSNQAGAISKQFRIVAGAARNTIYGAAATNPPTVDNATIITAIDTAYGADGALTTFVKTSKADGVQFAVANDQGQYSGWFAGSVINNDASGYQYGGNFSAAAANSKQRIRYRPSTNSAEAAIAYLTLTVPNGAQARKNEWANGAQIQPVSSDFSVDYVDSNLGSTPIALFRILPIWNADGTQVRFRRIFTGQIPDGFTEYWTFDKEGLFADPNRAVNPFQGRDIENVIWFPPNYVVHLECFWARGAEVNRGYAYGYCAAIGGATIYTGTKPNQTT